MALGRRFGRRRPLFWRWRAWRTGNPLLRTLAPLERAVGAVLLALAVLAVAGAALGAAATWRAGSATAAAQRGARYPVQAAVVGTADDATIASPDQLPSYTEKLSWTWQGVGHAGSRAGNPLAPSGATTTAWVDSSGELADEPWGTAETVATTLGAAAGAALTLAVLAYGVRRLFSGWLLRRHLVRWDLEWSQVEPGWTRRRPH